MGAHPRCVRRAPSSRTREPRARVRPGRGAGSRRAALPPRQNTDKIEATEVGRDMPSRSEPQEEQPNCPPASPHVYRESPASALFPRASACPGSHCPSVSNVCRNVLRKAHVFRGHAEDAELGPSRSTERTPPRESARTPPERKRATEPKFDRPAFTLVDAERPSLRSRYG